MLIVRQEPGYCCQDNATSHWPQRYHMSSHVDVTAGVCGAKQILCGSSVQRLSEFGLRVAAELQLLRGSCNLLPSLLLLSHGRLPSGPVTRGYGLLNTLLTKPSAATSQRGKLSCR